ncbi:MAG: MFS transporter [Bacteroidota bacterium]
MSTLATRTPRTRQRFVLIGLLFVHSVNTIMDRVAISAARDPIMQDLGINDQMMGYIFGIFALGYALFQIPSGWFADRFGPRKALTWVVSIWSTFTMLTGAAWNAASMLVLRFLFGAGEAGAFPGATRAFYRWLPVRERGMAHGINFSGTRLGGAIALFLIPGMIALVGWRWTFVINGFLGIVWAAAWLLWFRDEPRDNAKINAAEVEYIEEGQAEDFGGEDKGTFGQIFTSSNMLLAMYQYFAGNVTFFVTYTWLLPYLTDTWGQTAAIYAPLPLLMGAAGNLASGSLVTGLYKRGYAVASRRVPAIIGFLLGTVGLVLATQLDGLGPFIIVFSIAIFGVDMTLSPSWAFCMDIGGDKSGAVSASMNMVGNLGSAMSAVLFPFFVASVTIPGLVPATGSANSFFIFCAVLNVIAVGAWLLMNPNRPVDTSRTPEQVRLRVIAFGVLLFAGTTGLILYNLFF